MDNAVEHAATDQTPNSGVLDRAACAISGDAKPLAPSILRKRADFLRAAAARRQGMQGFLLQARRRADAEAADGVRVGFTCSKKIGNAVARNRAKRRLRAVVHETFPGLARPGWDYVLVGRPGATIDRDYAELKRDLEQALTRVHGENKPRAEKHGTSKAPEPGS